MEDEDVALNRKEESNSVSSQRNLLESFISNHPELNKVEVKEYCDDGFTGTKFERPGYMKLMEDVRAEKISCIVVKDLSRLGRDYIEVGSLLEQILPLYQVRVIAVNDNYDSDTYEGSTGGMNVAFKNLIYMLYSRDLSNKVSSAMHTRIMNKENISGQLRYGYVKDPDDKHKILIDPEAAEVVKLIFELTAQGMRKTDVANYLNSKGIDTPSAYKKRKGSKNYFHSVEVKSLWSTSSIRDILNDEVYLGKLIWNKTKKRVGNTNTSSYVPKDEWIIIDNCHEPIITQELFDKAQENTRQYIRAKIGKRNYNPFYYCGICGRALSTSKRVGGDILLCYSSRIEEDSPCKDNRVELTKIEEAVMKTVNMYAAAYLDEKGIKKAGRSKTVSPEVKIETLEKSIRNMSSKKMALYSDYKDEKISREQYVELSRKMVDQIEDMNQKIEKLKSEMQVEDTVSNKFTQQLESVINMESFNLELIQKVIKKVVINGEDNIEIVWNTDDPFFK
jgi:DNA invertase Pin-like site-specific DNA recombinase